MFSFNFKFFKNIRINKEIDVLERNNQGYVDKRINDVINKRLLLKQKK